MKNRSAPLAHPAMYKKNFLFLPQKISPSGNFFTLFAKKERKIKNRKEASVRYFYRRHFILKSNKKTDRL
jgi:hypothetical protein